MLQDWAQYIGHFHPLVVHLPIGILVVVFILEFVQSRAKTQQLNQAISISLAAGFFSAIISCLFGWFLAAEGGYEETTLELHRWMGISLAVITGVGWLIHQKKTANRKAFKIILFILFFLLMITGHLGGNMTHGEDYLTAGLPQPFAGWLGIEKKADTTAFVKKEITNINEALVYSDLVAPILNQRCYSCHSSVKVKGGLRLDTEDQIFKGGKHGPVIEKGNADASELIKRLLLPMEDDKRMPPKDKEPITPNEIALLRWWVTNGADTKKKVSELQPDSTAKLMLASFATGAVDSFKAAPVSKVFVLQPTAAKQEDIDALTKLGVIIHPLAKNKTLLEVSAVNYTAFDNNTAKLLAKLADNIVFLELANTKITDETMATIGQLKNLVKLNVSGTSVGSAGVAKLQSLVNLEYLNMVGTKLDDAGLQQLSSIKTLRNIYCWHTGVTDNGITQLKTKLPEVTVDKGD